MQQSGAVDAVRQLGAKDDDAIEAPLGDVPIHYFAPWPLETDRTGADRPL